MRGALLSNTENTYEFVIKICNPLSVLIIQRPLRCSNRAQGVSATPPTYPAPHEGAAREGRTVSPALKTQNGHTDILLNTTTPGRRTARALHAN